MCFSEKIVNYGCPEYFFVFVFAHCFFFKRKEGLGDNINDEILQYLPSYALVFQIYRTAVMGSLGWKENAHGVVVDVEAMHIDL